MTIPSVARNFRHNVSRAGGFFLGAILLLGCSGSSSAQTNSAAVTAVAQAFLATLSPAQSNAVIYAPTLANAGHWSNFPIYESARNGLSLEPLNATQRLAFLAVAYTALSSSGTNFYDEIRAMDEYLRVNVNANNYSPDKYYIAFVGTPVTNAPWLLQLSGHHASYNNTYNASYVSGSPMFLGTEPNSYTNASIVHQPLAIPVTIVATLRQSLTIAAQLSGTYTEVAFGVTPQTTYDDSFPNNYPTTGRGQLYTELTTNQQALVRAFIEFFVNQMPEEIAAGFFLDYQNPAALEQTYVGYSGSTNLNTLGSYFRVDGPRMWIEFNARHGVAYPGIAHWHSIWRDKLTDYGAAFGTNTISTTNRLPTITSHPVNQTNEFGSNVTFTVSATGPGTLNYQWYKNSEVIPTATNASYPITEIAATNAGVYRVRVGNFMGHRTSNPATLTTLGNTPPTLAAVGDQTINPGQVLAITNSVNDPDLPAQTFTFNLLIAPTNATLDSNSGVLAWRPLIAQADSTNAFAVSVTDSGSPGLSATQNFSVVVAPVVAPTHTAFTYTAGTYQMLISGLMGPDYLIQASTNLVDWATLDTTNPVVLPFQWTDASASNYPARFFRVLLGP